MKISTEPTDKIIMRVYSSSEYPICEYAILCLKDIDTDTIKRRIELTKTICETLSLAHVAYYEEVDKWIPHDFEDSIEEEVQGWAYLDATDDEVEEIPETEEDIRYGVMEVYSSGSIQYSANGKYTDTRYNTETFNILPIIEDYETRTR